MRALVLLLIVAAARAEPDENARLLTLLQEDHEEAMRRWPTWASSRGDRRYDDRLADLGEEARTRWLQHAAIRLEEMRALDRAKLTPANRTNAALFEYEMVRRLSEARFHPEQTFLDQLGGPQRDLPQLPASLSFTTDRHFEDYVTRLERVPDYIDQAIANLREGLADGRTPPRVVMGAAVEQALQHARPELEKDPTLHAMYPPFDAARASGPLADRAREAIRKRVVPAFRKLGTFLRDEYIPKCRESIAARDSVDGIDYYNSRLEYHTTLDVTADEIHATGRKEVARIRKEMMDVIVRTDFPRKDDFAAFVEYLRTDPRFYYTSAEDLLRGYRDLAKRIDAFMPQLFGRLPRLPYGVKEMPSFIAPASPTAYYYHGSIENGKPGYFIANTFRLDQRPKYEMIPLTLHEAVPGHHHQIALAQEMDGQPEWRTTRGYTAFVEGWALYAEHLGLEMPGLYDDPYDDFGRLSYEMWRAMRLVVDTGIHALGWPRKQAVDFMLENSAVTRQNVEREVDRYIAWPGQATAYKIGELRIRAIRARAEAALGDRFDLRAFHDAILEEGAIPLKVLEARMDAWIKAQL